MIGRNLSPLHTHTHARTPTHTRARTHHNRKFAPRLLCRHRWRYTYTHRHRHKHGDTNTETDTDQTQTCLPTDKLHKHIFYTFYSSNVNGILRCLGFFCYCLGGGGGGRENALKPKFWDTALQSVQCLVSFISFYFEILSYLACGENIIELASKNSVKLEEKSAGDF